MTLAKRLLRRIVRLTREARLIEGVGPIGPSRLVTTGQSSTGAGADDVMSMQMLLYAKVSRRVETLKEKRGGNTGSFRSFTLCFQTQPFAPVLALLVRVTQGTSFCPREAWFGLRRS